MKRIIANLGFLMQITGLITILPIGVGLALNELQSVVSLFIACVAFLSLGFIMNSLCERKELDFNCANVLLLAAFIILPLIGALPFFYSNPFNSPSIADLFTNGIFESVSGFTTTGFSFISSPETLPVSLLIYRSLTELMGGVGIVFLLLAFFQSDKSLDKLSNSLGIDNVTGNLKKTFFTVLGIYALIILLFTGIFYIIGFQDIANTGTFVIDTITGGFQPTISSYTPYLALAPKIGIIILMILGSLNFAFNYHLFTGKFRRLLTSETVLYLLIMVIGAILISAAANINFLDSFFHAVSMSSGTGQSFIELPQFGNTGYSILIVLMLIGGCSFSMAGGIRVYRIINFVKAVKDGIWSLLKKENGFLKFPKKTENDRGFANMSATIVIILFVFVLVIFSVIFTTIGVTFTDALFEVGSALTTNGISMGATTVGMGIGYKWLLIAAMTIGRIEILSLLIALFSFIEKRSCSSK